MSDYTKPDTQEAYAIKAAQQNIQLLIDGLPVWAQGAIKMKAETITRQQKEIEELKKLEDTYIKEIAELKALLARKDQTIKDLFAQNHSLSQGHYEGQQGIIKKLAEALKKENWHGGYDAIIEEAGDVLEGIAPVNSHTCICQHRKHRGGEGG